MIFFNLVIKLGYYEAYLQDATYWEHIFALIDSQVRTWFLVFRQFDVLQIQWKERSEILEIN